MKDDDASGPIYARARTMKVVESAINELWSVVNELSRVQPERRDRFRVAVFGSARTRPGLHLYEEVTELARQLAERGCDIVTGAGPGLMAAANEGENLGDPDGSTRSVGLSVFLPFEDEINPFVELAYEHRTFFSRLAQFVRLANAFVIVDGGIGTTLETMMVWQLLQVRHIAGVPLILVGPMWRELVGWARRHMVEVDDQLASPADLEIPICVDTVAGAMGALDPYITRFRAEP